MKEKGFVQMPSALPQGRFGQFPPNMYLQQSVRGSQFLPGNASTNPSPVLILGEVLLSQFSPISNQQAQFHHPQAYSPYPKQARQQVQTPYLMGQHLEPGTRGCLGLLGSDGSHKQTG
eukprot:TRINITY_DN29631_c0_g1_i1.p2 TRINITY_DN29631_c0_g1~~TRINITY_DN29631_c0_g1_i1.p2  ORF type:complete len:118 (+),score=27.77 TRINITY_DN29631_c0_g1_i1:289-642(+)